MVCRSHMSRAIYQLNCFGQEPLTKGILLVTRWRMLLQAGRPPSVSLSKARLDTPRKLTSFADRCFCGSLPSRVLLPNTFPTQSLLCRCGPLLPPDPCPRKRKHTMEERIRELRVALHTLLAGFHQVKAQEFGQLGPEPRSAATQCCFCQHYGRVW